jgi:hypothetical protein
LNCGGQLYVDGAVERGFDFYSLTYSNLFCARDGVGGNLADGGVAYDFSFQNPWAAFSLWNGTKVKSFIFTTRTASRFQEEVTEQHLFRTLLTKYLRTADPPSTIANPRPNRLLKNSISTDSASYDVSTINSIRTYNPQHKGVIFGCFGYARSAPAWLFLNIRVHTVPVYRQHPGKDVRSACCCVWQSSATLALNVSGGDGSSFTAASEADLRNISA